MITYFTSCLIVACVAKNHIGARTNKLVTTSSITCHGSGYSDVSDSTEQNNGSFLPRALKIEKLLNSKDNIVQKDVKTFNFEFDQGNPDINAAIVRPCEIYDASCIRRFFASHSNCQLSEGTVPEPLYRSQVTANYPRVNMSAIENNVEYRGLNGRVEGFYINKATDNLVIVIEFDSISLFSNNTYLKIYLKGREPIVTMDFGGLSYGKISVTVVMPNINDLRLDKAEMYSYISQPIFPFIFGPGLSASTDPEVSIMIAAFVADLRVNLQEALLTEGPFYAATYIQKSICDFGLNVL